MPVMHIDMSEILFPSAFVKNALCVQESWKGSEDLALHC